jgi:hypothetical protein
VAEVHKEAAKKHYIKTGKRIRLSDKRLGRMLDMFFNFYGHLVPDVLYQDKVMGNAIVEGLYLELKKIKAERTYRQVLLDILAANNQKKTALYARISNDKITRG